MKRVVISGYYGFDNTGDEAILTGILKNLLDEARLKGEELDFTLLSQNPPSTSLRYQVKAIKRTDFKAILKALRSSQVFISGGGGLLQDVTGRQFSVFYYLGLVLLAWICRCRVVIYAQGMGPIKKSFNRWLTARILGLSDLITVRDLSSQQFLKEIGLKKEAVVTADPAFLLEPPGGTVRGNNNGPSMGVSVHPRCTSKDLQVLARTLDHMVKKHRARVVLIPFYPAQDQEPSREVLNYMQSPAEIIETEGEVKKVLELVGKMDVMVGARLHSLIFAALTKVPFAGISYDPKVDSFLKECRLSPGGHVDNLEENYIIEIMEHLWNNKEEIKDRLDHQVRTFKKDAAVNGKLVLELMDE